MEVMEQKYNRQCLEESGVRCANISSALSLATCDLKPECGQSFLKITADIKCLTCKIVFKNTSEVQDILLSMDGKLSVKDAFENFFENETVEKFKCIGCMKSVSASKKWKMLYAPEELRLIMNNDPIKQEASKIEIDQNLILKCCTESGVRYWNYELATSNYQAGQSFEKDSYFTHMLNTSKEQQEYVQPHHIPLKLIYKRIEEVIIEDPIEFIPTITILTDSEISSDEIQMEEISEMESRSSEVDVTTNQYLKKGKTPVTELTSSKPTSIRERSMRVAKRNKQFFDSAMWENISLESSPPSTISPKTDIKDESTSRIPPSGQSNTVTHHLVLKELTETKTDPKPIADVMPDRPTSKSTVKREIRPKPDRSVPSTSTETTANPNPMADVMPDRPNSKTNAKCETRPKPIKNENTARTVQSGQLKSAVPVRSVPSTSTETTANPKPMADIMPDRPNSKTSAKRETRPKPIKNENTARTGQSGQLKSAVPVRSVPSTSTETTANPKPMADVMPDRPNSKTSAKRETRPKPIKNENTARTVQSGQLKSAVPVRSVPKASVGTTKTKNLIRLRYQIDCRDATELNIDGLIKFLKENMKVNGKNNNLAGISFTRKNSDINIMSKVLLKKKYFKFLAKKYLKKNKESKYRVIKKNERAYRIILK